MGGFSGSGGGYFYGPFTSTQNYSRLALAAGALPLAFGAWAHYPAGTALTGKGRWVSLSVWPNGVPYGNVYILQLGRGAPGAEIPFQPSVNPIPGGFPGFYIDFFTTWNDGLGHFQLNTIPWTISFPTSIGLNQEMCARCSSVPGAGALIMDMYIFN